MPILSYAQQGKVSMLLERYQVHAIGSLVVADAASFHAELAKIKNGVAS